MIFPVAKISASTRTARKPAFSANRLVYLLVIPSQRLGERLHHETGVIGRDVGALSNFSAGPIGRLPFEFGSNIDHSEFIFPCLAKSSAVSETTRKNLLEL